MATIRVLMTGGRNWDNAAAMERKLEEVSDGFDEFILYHGGARGADRMAGRIALALGGKVEVFNADWDQHGKSAGFIRNEAMRDAFIADGGGPVIAFKQDFDNEMRRGGTEHMVRICREAGLHGWGVRG